MQNLDIHISENLDRINFVWRNQKVLISLQLIDVYIEIRENQYRVLNSENYKNYRAFDV